MNTDRARWLLLGGLALLSACQTDEMGGGKPVSTFGEANRQTMMAQVVDPDPEYDTINPPTSGERAGMAGERYRADKVKKPERVRSTQGGSGS